MGKDIYQQFAEARQVIDECDEALGGGLRDIMFKGPQEALTLTANTQPAILCVSIALLRVIEKSLGFQVKDCSYALGHSLGEYSALVATGALQLRDAIQLVRLRGQAMQSCISNKETAMRALLTQGDHLDEIEDIVKDMQQWIKQHDEVAEIANINSRTQIVLSGTQKGVEYAVSLIHSKGYTGRSLPLPVSAPFHCSLMQPAADSMQSALAKTRFSLPSIDVISNVTGKPFERHDEIGALLTKQITHPVQWDRCVRYAKDGFVFDWIVVGPSRVLYNLIRKEFPHDSVR